jgi:serine protease Do
MAISHRLDVHWPCKLIGESSSIMQPNWQNSGQTEEQPLQPGVQGAAGSPSPSLKSHPDDPSNQPQGSDLTPFEPADMSLDPADGAWAKPYHKSGNSTPGLVQMAGSTLISLMMVLTLLVVARWMVPSLVESLRYSWHSGQLRAEYELSDQRLRTVSLDSLADVSQLVSQRLGPSVVHVNLLREPGTIQEFEKLYGSNNPSLRYEGQGSGFIVSPDGYILTNHHVVADAERIRIEVTLSDGRCLPADVVGFDSKTDLAVLKVKATNLMPVEWGNSDSVGVGSPVWAVGSPYGLHQTVTFGIISGVHRLDLRGTRYQENFRDSAYGDLMQSDVAVNPGNSGGPLVNSKGQVVGVNAAILGESYRGISFSIPSRVAKRVADSLIGFGEVARGWLGVRMEELSHEERFDSNGQAQPGVRISGFPSGEPSPARQAGLRVGDVIIEFQGKPVMSQSELMHLIGQCDAGSTASVVVRREAEPIELNVILAKRNTKL